MARTDNLEHLVDLIKDVESSFQNKNIEMLWSTVREAPMNLGTSQNECIVQIIDEFQFLNSEIYWDEGKTNRASDFAAGYMHTAEYKNAPLIVSGSWEGWLHHELMIMLPGRWEYAVIGEVKYRDTQKFSRAEAEEFLKKNRVAEAPGTRAQVREHCVFADRVHPGGTGFSEGT